MTVQIENRGTEEVPFGYVYVREGVRVGYSMASEDGTFTVWGDASAYWTEPTDEEATEALVALSETFAVTKFESV